ncbi:MAG: Na/Pi cotransporter family protein [Myxococcales bacterium]|nr:Na/Pi cotransporter family protein [Myxococcales bacterium]
MEGGSLGTLLGGIGLFLLGMSLMTDSLVALGGRSLRSLLKRLAGHRMYALLVGAAVTATVQSSSATTLITVGFVGAGLLTFTQSLGFIFGANIGTTSTAWLVSLVGLKMSVSAVALPLVGVGALVRLFTRGRRARLGLAIAGFGLVFVGIDVMQAGMSGIDVDLGAWAGRGGLLSTLLLVLVGLVMTVIMQSSSAAVATTLVALHAGSITLSQAAALVIGQNVGTTVTAILGAMGGGLAARRAAVAHTVFNAATGAVALLLLPLFIGVAERLGGLADDSATTAIAVFHTLFNVMGVAIFFPLLPRFATVVERLVPPRDVVAVEPPARAALQVPALALEGARRAVADATVVALTLGFELLQQASARNPTLPPLRRAVKVLTDPRSLLDGEDETTRSLATRLRGLRTALDSVALYLGRINTSGEATALRDEHVELLHAIDHTRRLGKAIEDAGRLELVRSDPGLRRLAAEVVRNLDPLMPRLSAARDVETLAEIAKELRVLRKDEAEHRDAYRVTMLARVADGDTTPEDADALMSASRWIAKLPRHAYRAFLHLGWTAGAPALPSDED